jgi:hypothetical protein
MRVIILFTCLQLLGNILAGQEKVITVHASMLERLPDSAKYKYPSFTKGNIFYRNGSQAYANFNVNLLLNEIQFLHPNGDTLSIVDQESIRFITIGQDSFFCKKEIVQLMPGYSPLKLGRSEKITVLSRERVGAYGESSGTTSITSFGSLSANDQVYQLKANENILLKKQTTFYFIRNDFLTFLTATKSNLLQMVKNKDGVQEYLRNNDIDFKKEGDLKKVLEFVNSRQ